MTLPLTIAEHAALTRLLDAALELPNPMVPASDWYSLAAVRAKVLGLAGKESGK